MRTAVIVIGDLGRSPRMQYHAASLAAAGSDVDLIGLEGTAVMPVVSSNPRIHVHRMPDRAFANRAKGGVRRFVFSSAARGLGQAMRMFSLLMRIPKPDLILVQNPPAFPTLFIAWLASRLRGARFVIDWHNLSHTIAAVRLGERHRAVKSIARSERRWAKRATAHLAVSQALADWLAREYKVKAAVVYDRPGDTFTRPSAADAEALWERVANGRAARCVAATDRRLSDQLDARRGFRSAARSAGARRAAADAQRRWRGTGTAPCPCCVPDRARRLA